MITIKHIIFLALIYIVPIQSLKRIYLHDREKFKVAKVINLVITVIIFYILIGDSGFYLMYSDFKSFKEIYAVDTGLINSKVNMAIKIISDIVSIYFFVVVIGLSRRIKRDRKMFLYLLPIMTILLTIQFNRQLYAMGEEFENENLNLLFAFVWTSIKFIILFLVYNSKAFKKMMSLNYKMIKDLNIGSA